MAVLAVKVQKIKLVIVKRISIIGSCSYLLDDRVELFFVHIIIAWGMAMIKLLRFEQNEGIIMLLVIMYVGLFTYRN